MAKDIYRTGDIQMRLKAPRSVVDDWCNYGILECSRSSKRGWREITHQAFLRFLDRHVTWMKHHPPDEVRNRVVLLTEEESLYQNLLRESLKYRDIKIYWRQELREADLTVRLQVATHFWADIRMPGGVEHFIQTMECKRYCNLKGTAFALPTTPLPKHRALCESNLAFHPVSTEEVCERSFRKSERVLSV